MALSVTGLGVELDDRARTVVAEHATIAARVNAAMREPLRPVAVALFGAWADDDTTATKYWTVHLDPHEQPAGRSATFTAVELTDGYISERTIAQVNLGLDAERIDGPLTSAVRRAKAAASGDSNDEEIDALNEALKMVCELVGLDTELDDTES